MIKRSLALIGPLNMAPGCMYGDYAASQAMTAFPVLEKLINEYSPEIIIEIGFFRGGLSLFLADLNICEVVSYDIQNHGNLPEADNLTLCFEDCHSEETIDKIGSLTQGKKTLWLIDGGDKQKEFNAFTRIIKKGELAMTHDFAPDEEGERYLKENNLWHWWESSLQGLNLEQYKKHEDFEEIWKTAMWGAFVKIN